MNTISFIYPRHIKGQKVYKGSILEGDFVTSNGWMIHRNLTLHDLFEHERLGDGKKIPIRLCLKI